mmetsp:Transcript_56772/g.105065  ORF Transcript_56772/g.105065 Transcript_56772/m.105065 type:complete len:111 (+) Transcript_56772:92-424(+)
MDDELLLVAPALVTSEDCESGWLRSLQAGACVPSAFQLAALVAVSGGHRSFQQDCEADPALDGSQPSQRELLSQPAPPASVRMTLETWERRPVAAQALTAPLSRAYWSSL